MSTVSKNVSFFHFRQHLVYEWFYFDQRSRREIYQNIYHKGCFESSTINFQLKKPKVAIVDVFIDEEFNLLCLAQIDGSPHVMSSSLYTTGCSRIIHRFGDYLEPLTCILIRGLIKSTSSNIGWIFKELLLQYVLCTC